MAETGAMTATQAVPPPRKHRHRYHEVLAPNHKLRRAVTALAIGNIRKRREAATGGHGGKARVTDGCCDANQKPRSHDTSRIAWAKLMARVGEEFPLECPGCGGDIRLIAFRLLSECETIPGALLATSGCCGLPVREPGADPEGPHASGRTARASASLSCPWPAHRLGRARPGPLSTGRFFRRHPSSCP
jgi:hypothetical protein